MCGIYLSENMNVDPEIVKLISNRGEKGSILYTEDGLVYITSVLHIRGTVKQPYSINPLILYNGEVYNNSHSDTKYICDLILLRHKNYRKFIEPYIKAGQEKLAHKRKIKVADIPIYDGFDIISEAYFEYEKILDEENIHTKNSLSDNSKVRDIEALYYFYPEDGDGEPKVQIETRSSFFSSKLYMHDICTSIDADNEFAIIIAHKNYIVFYKDYIGRKSLGYSMKNGFTVSSVNFEYEADPNYIYMYDRELTVLLRKRREIPIKTHFNFYTQDTLEKYLQESVRKRLHPFENVVAFSGGVDSLLITDLLHSELSIEKPIYLVNTMFVYKKDSKDRINGQISYLELKKRIPQRNFIFIKNDITHQKLKKYEAHIRKLMYPKVSIMDFSIAATLFFTAKRAAKLSRVLFLGCGADELFGGYKSHIGIKDLRQRLRNDISNIYDRNCGRDDRVISDNMVEARYPFLDIDVVRTGLNLDINLYIKKEGDKYVNKAVLRDILGDSGLEKGSRMKKVAMQFGSGITKYDKIDRNDTKNNNSSSTKDKITKSIASNKK